MDEGRDLEQEGQEREEVHSILRHCSRILEERGKRYGSWKVTFGFSFDKSYVPKFEKVNLLVTIKIMRLMAVRAAMRDGETSRETIGFALDSCLDAINYLGMAASVLVAELKEREDKERLAMQGVAEPALGTCAVPTAAAEPLPKKGL